MTVSVAAIVAAAVLLTLAVAIEVAAARRQEPFVDGLVSAAGADIVNVDHRCTTPRFMLRGVDGMQQTPDGHCVLRTGGYLTCEAATDPRATRGVGRDAGGRCVVELNPDATAADLEAYERRLVDLVVEGSKVYRAKLAEHDTKVITAANKRAVMEKTEAAARAAEEAAEAEAQRAPPGYAADTGPLPGGGEVARFHCPMRCENDGLKRFTGDWFASPSETHGYCKCAPPKNAANPTAPMSGPETAGYKASSTSEAQGREAWRAFDRSSATWWTSGEGTYEQEDGGKHLAENGGPGSQDAKGEFLAIQCDPKPFVPAYYVLSPRADSRYALVNTNPNAWTLLGWPADGSGPVQLDKRRGVAWKNTDFRKFGVSGAGGRAFKGFILVVHGVGNPGTRDHSSVSLAGLVIYGA